MKGGNTTIFLLEQKIDVRRGSGPSAAADAKEIHEAKTQIGLGETGHAAGKVVFFIYMKTLKKGD